MSLLEKVEFAATSLEEGHTTLVKNIAQQELTFECIEGLAKVRFALGVVAKVLCTQSPRGHLQITKILEVARAIVEDATINQTGAGPAIYLLKVIVRRYGISFMIDLQKQHNWLVSSCLLKSEKVYMYFQFMNVHTVLPLRAQTCCNYITCYLQGTYYVPQHVHVKMKHSYMQSYIIYWYIANRLQYSM